MRRMRERRRAEGLKPVVTWISVMAGQRPDYSPHRLSEARSLAMHALIARKVDRDPDLLAIAQQNLARWKKRWGAEVPPWHAEWESLLARSWREIAARITEPSEDGARLRQSSPFAGVLTQRERKRIYETFRA
jgi:hypothetical protein